MLGRPNNFTGFVAVGGWWVGLCPTNPQPSATSGFWLLGSPAAAALYISNNLKFNTMDNQQETKNNTLFCKSRILRDYT
jgi:hypothetical protein